MSKKAAKCRLDVESSHAVVVEEPLNFNATHTEEPGAGTKLVRRRDRGS
jgi:hypothetical protein